MSNAVEHLSNAADQCSGALLGCSGALLGRVAQAPSTLSSAVSQHKPFGGQDMDCVATAQLKYLS